MTAILAWITPILNNWKLILAAISIGGSFLYGYGAGEKHIKDQWAKDAIKQQQIAQEQHDKDQKAADSAARMVSKLLTARDQMNANLNQELLNATNQLGACRNSVLPASSVQLYAKTAKLPQ